MTAVNTTLSAGTDNQVFCYDDQNRLTWAGASGTPDCGTSLTPGSLTSAGYTQLFTYDSLDRLQSGPLGSYTYGDSAHLHAATSIGTNTYTASYDAHGDMTCRAPDNTATCTGTPTGAVLGYDNEGRLASWQNAPSNPTTTDSFLYDGEGNRVAQSVTINGSILINTTYVAGGLEEIKSDSGGTTLTKYFSGASGLPTAERVGTNGTLSYLASDGQGKVSESLDASGTVTSEQLYTPYGNVRYSSGSSPTSMGYTGQRADGATGLDYYHARYYDPVAGQFTSADTVKDGLNRFGYVAGNPTTATDPSGHRRMCDSDCWAPTPAPTTTPTPTGSGGSSSSTGRTCDSICQDNRGKGFIDIGIGIGILLGLGVAIGAACLGPWAEFTCAPVWRGVVPFIFQGIHSILEGADLLHQSDGGQVGDSTTVFIRFAIVLVDVFQAVLSIANVVDAVKNLGRVLSELSGIKQGVEGLSKIAEYDAKIANATSTQQKGGFVSARKALVKDTANTLVESITGITAGFLGLKDLGDDLIDFHRSLEEWSSANAA